MKRVPALDGLRGVLACIVLAYHASAPGVVLFGLSKLAVFAFFVISGWVLTLSWDGRYLRFLLCRFARLWPVYALCLGLGYLFSGYPVIWTQFFWVPLIGADDPIKIDPPAWSLCIEAFAMPAMPLFVWATQGHRVRLYVGVAACLCGAVINANVIAGSAFLGGAWLSRFRWNCRMLEWWLPQWLGRISYPLYLSHWLILRYVPAAAIVKIPLAFAAAWLLSISVERWSIAASQACRRARFSLGQTLRM